MLTGLIVVIGTMLFGALAMSIAERYLLPRLEDRPPRIWFDYGVATGVTMFLIAILAVNWLT